MGQQQPGIRMAWSAELLAVADGPEQDGYRIRRLAGHDDSLGQANARRGDSRVPGREFAAPLGQHPLVPENGLSRIPGRQVCGGQLTGYDLGIRVTGCQLGVAEGGQVPPVFNGRPDQAGFVEALPGLQQQRMTSVRP